MDRHAVDISARSIMRVLLAALIVAATIRLAPLLVLLTISALVAVTLDPLVVWMRRKGLPGWAAILATVILVVALILVFGFLIFPTLIDQVNDASKQFPQFKSELLARTPDQFRGNVDRVLRNPEALVGKLPDLLLKAGVTAFNALATLGVILTFAFYLIIDGRNAFIWFISFFEPRTQGMFRQTGEEMSQVIFAYMAGQLITSVMASAVAFGLLSALHVPAALVLAVLAGVCDLVPVLGLLVFTASAAIAALAVSSQAALIVCVVYMGYHLLENYVIVPRVYGRKMKLSTLVVLLALSAGALLGDMAGVLLALPIAASYPIIERIWLRKQLGEQVIERHEELQEQSEKG